MTPATAAAGQTSVSALHPPMVSTRYAGRMRETGAQIRPTTPLTRSTGSPVTAASVMTGMPMEPNATGAVLASKHSEEA